MSITTTRVFFSKYSVWVFFSVLKWVAIFRTKTSLQEMYLVFFLLILQITKVKKGDNV